VSNVCYYVDEHIGGVIVNGLRQRGIDVMTVTEAGLRGSADEIHLAFARNAGRTIFTQDRDFLRLAASGVRHAGVVYASQGTPIGKIVAGLFLIHSALSAEEMMNSVEFL
jgi:hypothetical protein